MNFEVILFIFRVKLVYWIKFRDEKIVVLMIGWGVFFNICKFYEGGVIKNL